MTAVRTRMKLRPQVGRVDVILLRGAIGELGIAQVARLASALLGNHGTRRVQDALGTLVSQHGGTG